MSRAVGKGSPDAPPPSVVERISRVERSLLPRVSITGRREYMPLEHRMAHYRVPGVSIAVISDGRIDWARGYGTRDVEDGGRVDERTLFQACSISKPVAAIAALTLVERGLVDIDEDVNAKLRSWKVPENAFTREQPVTLRRILSHTAGLTVHGVPGHARDVELPSLPSFLDGKHPDSPEPVQVDVLPGSVFRYSGGGIIVMQQLVEDVTSRPFAAFVREVVLDPLGMTDSTYDQPLPQQAWAQAASGHQSDERPIDGKWTTFAASAAGGMWTTPTDLARYAMDVQDTFAGRSAHVLSERMTREMLFRQHPLGLAGLGPWIEGDGAAKRFYHSGSNIGYRCHLVAYTESGQGAAVMTNSDNGEPLVMEILNAVADVYGWPGYLRERSILDVDAVTLARHVGAYEINPNLTISVRLRDDHLVASAAGFGEGRLYAESRERFFLVELPVEMTFVSDDDGVVRSANVEAFGLSVRANKL